MIAIPAVDLREGACVQLVGGMYEDERVRLADPVSVARGWAGAGFRHLHLVDLDATTGRGSNETILRAIAGEPGLVVQAGGGVRSEADVQSLLDAGAARVVVGTRALEEPGWLAGAAERFPHRLVVAADVRDGRVLTRGWQRMLPRSALEVIADLDGIPVAAVLVTAVHCEGRLGGTDMDLMAGAAARSRAPVHASGGITTMQDLHALARSGVAGAIIGMALYTGALDPRAVAEEFAE